MGILRAGAPALGFAAICLLSSTPAPADTPSIAVELNKLEPSGGSCRAYLVVSNESKTGFKAFKLDLVLFQNDGVIGRRFAVDLAPLRPSKRSVKLFDIDGTSCDSVGSFLINDVLECEAESGVIGDCLAALNLSSLSQVKLTK
jgi:hypothetical protein